MKIFVLFGEGDLYGSGHRVRMGELSRLLKESGVSVVEKGVTESFLSPESSLRLAISFFTDPDSRPDLILLDARDMNPFVFADFAPTVALDNNHPLRFRQNSSHLDFYDTLPHPGASPDIFLKNFLLSDHFAGSRPEGPKKKQILIYAGPFDPGDLDSMPEMEGWKAVCVGTIPKEKRGQNGIEWHSFLEERKFRSFVQESAVVVSYSGQTLFEGWACGGLPVLLSVESEVHRELSRRLRSFFPVPELDLLSWKEQGERYFINLIKNRNLPEISRGGYERLVAFLLRRS